MYVVPVVKLKVYIYRCENCNLGLGPSVGGFGPLVDVRGPLVIDVWPLVPNIGVSLPAIYEMFQCLI